MNSMTGFGKGVSQNAAGDSVTVELSGVNRKVLEIRFNLPSVFVSQETELRKRLSAKLRRGTVNCRVSCTAAGSSTAAVNREVLENYLAVCEELKRKTGASYSISQLLALPGVTSSAAEVPETFPETLFRALDQALDSFCAMRCAEGEALKCDFEERLHLLETLLQKIEPETTRIAASMKQRLLDKLAAEKIPVPDNDGSLLREALFYADKSDVTEEITRIRSHFAQFRSFLEPKAEDAGRSLDFLMQELFREITTLGNKAGSCAVSPLVVRFKTELEKLREQIQNVE